MPKQHFFDRKEALKEVDRKFNEAIEKEMPSARRKLLEEFPEWEGDEKKIEEFLRNFRNKVKVKMIETFKKEMIKIRQENIRNNSSAKLT